MIKEILIDAALLKEDGPVLASYSAHLFGEGRINKPFTLGAYEWVITATHRKDGQATKVWARKTVPSDAPEKPAGGKLYYFEERAYFVSEEEIVFFAAPGSLKVPPREDRKPRRPKPSKPGQGGLF